MLSFKELRLQRIRHDITAKEMAKHLGVSYGWLRSIEKQFYNGPCVDEWRSRYETALRELIEEEKRAR